MNKLFAPLLAKLPAFALPFVTRSLRGDRGRRYLSLSLLLVALTLILGLWIGLGRGSLEQGVRVGLGLEAHEMDREQQEFVVYFHDSHEQQEAERSLALLREQSLAEPWSYGYEVQHIVERGLLLASAASSIEVYSPDQAVLRKRAQALVERQLLQLSEQAQHELRSDEGSPMIFSWRNPRHLATLARVLDADGVPELRRYESPLGLRESLRVVGFLAGLLLAACVTVLGPLAVAVQQGEERHENTLMPLAGTSLTPRELALGLAAGPSAVVAIFALPQLLLFVAAVVVVGKLTSGLALLAALAASAVFVTLAAQLLAHLVGQRRTPGMVGVALLALLSIAWLFGAAVAVDLRSDSAGTAALLPTIGLAWTLGHTFLELPTEFRQSIFFSGEGASAAKVMFSMAAWSAAALVFASLILTVLSRTSEGREGPLLRARAGLLGALTCMALVHVALPWSGSDAGMIHFYLGLGLLALPLALLLMARIPIGDTPPRLRQIPVPKLLAEFAGWAALHMALSVALVGYFDEFNSQVYQREEFNPGALLWVAWCVAVLGLLAIRVAAVPAKLIDHLVGGFCGFGLFVASGQALYCVVEQDSSFFVLGELSPVLGVLQLAAAVAIPLVLILHLRKNLGSVSSAEPSIPTETR